MKIVRQDHKILDTNIGPLRHIEKIGRLCYKSEDKITDTSASKFVRILREHKHYAMLEHYRFIMRVDIDAYYYLDINAGEHLRYFNITEIKDGAIISFSARGILEVMDSTISDDLFNVLQQMCVLIIEKYNCEELFGVSIADIELDENLIYDISLLDIDSLSNYDKYIHGWMSVKFICDRGVSHELVRHRDASFAQESTRYCNYSQDKFERSIQVILPSMMTIAELATWNETCIITEIDYFELLKSTTPEIARGVLPTSLKTEIVVTATYSEWIHIFNLRVLGTTGKPHPQIYELMKPLYDNFIGDVDMILKTCKCGKVFVHNPNSIYHNTKDNKQVYYCGHSCWIKHGGRSSNELKNMKYNSKEIY